jgi:aldose 1-epimerase
MKQTAICLALLLATLFAGCSSKPKPAVETLNASQSQASQSQPISIGGEPAVVLQRTRSAGQEKPEFVSATVLPGRGMNIWQIRAYIPGKGEIDLLTAPSLADAKTLLDTQDDEFGNKGFSAGGALLVPWANRIRGKLSADKKTITTTIAGRDVTLPANWRGKKPEAVINAMHGLILKAPFQGAAQQMKTGSDPQQVAATYHAGNFNGHWVSDTDLEAKVELKGDAVELTVTAKNVGKEPLPLGFGWHPYFAIPSGDRKQARLQLAADHRALVDNYDDVFPTGKTEPVKGTKYDFTAAGGHELGDLYMDDNFTNVKHNGDGSSVSEIIDPAAKYGLRIVALNPEVKAVQIYAPPDKAFIVLEPQTNLADPYNKIWGKTDTGMIILKPGESYTYKVRLELFVPTAAH